MNSTLIGERFFLFEGKKVPIINISSLYKINQGVPDISRYAIYYNIFKEWMLSIPNISVLWNKIDNFISDNSNYKIIIRSTIKKGTHLNIIDVIRSMLIMNSLYNLGILNSGTMIDIIKGIIDFERDCNNERWYRLTETTVDRSCKKVYFCFERGYDIKYFYKLAEVAANKSCNDFYLLFNQYKCTYDELNMINLFTRGGCISVKLLEQFVLYYRKSRPLIVKCSEIINLYYDLDYRIVYSYAKKIINDLLVIYSEDQIKSVLSVNPVNIITKMLDKMIVSLDSIDPLTKMIDKVMEDLYSIDQLDLIDQLIIRDIESLLKLYFFKPCEMTTTLDAIKVDNSILEDPLEIKLPDRDTTICGIY